jgi:hypothetical protein
LRREDVSAFLGGSVVSGVSRRCPDGRTEQVSSGTCGQKTAPAYFFMTPTTHIASSCLLTTVMVHSGAGEAVVLAVLSIGSLALHFLLDCIPHGFITTPWTIFKKFTPTAIELIPGPLILAAAILIFGHPWFFLLAAAFSLLPDICSTLVWKRTRVADMYPLRALHRLHRLVHWFEIDNPDGSVSHLFSNWPLLAVEACLLVLILGVHFF